MIRFRQFFALVALSCVAYVPWQSVVDPAYRRWPYVALIDVGVLVGAYTALTNIRAQNREDRRRAQLDRRGIRPDRTRHRTPAGLNDTGTPHQLNEGPLDDEHR